MRHIRDVPRSAPLSVLCYPQQWESVSFYLPRADVHAYGERERDQTGNEVRVEPDSLHWRELDAPRSRREARGRRDRVAGNRFICVADMRRAVRVADRRRNVEGFGHVRRT